MNTAAKTKNQASASKPVSSQKLNEVKANKRRPKVKLGTGRHLGFISDTLFDEDLKQ